MTHVSALLVLLHFYYVFISTWYMKILVDHCQEGNLSFPQAITI